MKHYIEISDEFKSQKDLMTLLKKEFNIQEYPKEGLDEFLKKTRFKIEHPRLKKIKTEKIEIILSKVESEIYITEIKWTEEKTMKWL